jgi:hypothetical protein
MIPLIGCVVDGCVIQDACDSNASLKTGEEDRMFELKKLSETGIEGALSKAERYRLLNEPWQAESICRDVLATDPENQRAIVMLILSLTDQFGGSGGIGFDEAKSLLAKLRSEYEQAYYAGIVCERRANVHFERGHPGCGELAYEWYKKALDWFEKAEKLRPPANEDAALRWNTCARMMMKHPTIRPAQHQAQAMLE